MATLGGGHRPTNVTVYTYSRDKAACVDPAGDILGAIDFDTGTNAGLAAADGAWNAFLNTINNTGDLYARPHDLPSTIAPPPGAVGMRYVVVQRKSSEGVALWAGGVPPAALLHYCKAIPLETQFLHCCSYNPI